jgi:hypothetical protein
LLGDQLAQTLPRPRDFAAASESLTPGAVAAHFACGPAPKTQFEALDPYVEAGFDEVYVQQIGSHHEEFFRLWRDEMLPALT